MSFLLPLAASFLPEAIDWVGGWWEDVFGDGDEDEYYDEEYDY